MTRYEYAEIEASDEDVFQFPQILSEKSADGWDMVDFTRDQSRRYALIRRKVKDAVPDKDSEPPLIAAEDYDACLTPDFGVFGDMKVWLGVSMPSIMGACNIAIVGTPMGGGLSVLGRTYVSEESADLAEMKKVVGDLRPLIDKGDLVVTDGMFGTSDVIRLGVGNICRYLNVQSIVVDPYYWHGLKVTDDVYGHLLASIQIGRMRLTDPTIDIFNAISRRRFRHDGNAIMRSHFLNMSGVESEYGGLFPRSRHPIGTARSVGLAMAACMANAVRLDPIQKESANEAA